MNLKTDNVANKKVSLIMDSLLREAATKTKNYEK